MSQQPLIRSLAVAAALALAAAPASAGGKVAGFVLLPPQPVMTPPLAYVPQTTTMYPPPVVPMTPFQPPPPQTTYFTPPQAVPIIIPAHPAHRH